MEYPFKAQTSNSKDSFKTLANIVYTAQAGPRKIMIWVIAACFIGGSLISLIQVGFSIPTFIVFLLSCLIPLINQAMVLRLTKMIAKTTPRDEQMVFTFGESSFSVANQKGETENFYSKVEKVVETRRYYYIFMKNTLCHCIAKGAFVQGDESEFLSFLKGKCNEDTFFGRFPGRCYKR